MIIDQYRFPSGAAFSPSDIAGMVLWFKADQIGGLSNNDPVSTWQDQSGGGHDAAGSGTTRPLYKTNVQNGLPGVKFDGSDDFLNGSVVMGGTTLSAFVVATMANSQNYQRFVSLGATGNNDYGDTKYAAAILRDAGNAALNGYRNGSPLSTKAISYLTAFNAASVFDSANYNIYVNNSGGTAAGSSGTFDISKFALGCNVGNTADSNLDGYMFEVCVYTSAFSSGDRANLEAYAAAKWGTP